MFTIREGTTQDEVDARLRVFEVVRQPANILWCAICDAYRRAPHGHPVDSTPQLRWEILPLGPPSFVQFGGNV